MSEFWRMNRNESVNLRICLLLLKVPRRNDIYVIKTTTVSSLWDGDAQFHIHTLCVFSYSKNNNNNLRVMKTICLQTKFITFRSYHDFDFGICVLLFTQSSVSPSPSDSLWNFSLYVQHHVWCENSIWEGKRFHFSSGLTVKPFTLTLNSRNFLKDNNIWSAKLPNA